MSFLPPAGSMIASMCRSLLWETTDARNRHFFGGKLENETINGWGYDRVMLRELGPMAGTRMAADPNVPKIRRFIALGRETRTATPADSAPIGPPQAGLDR